MSAAAANDTPLKFIAAGWALASPKLGHFKAFLAANKSSVSVQAIVFESRRAADIEGIPILTPEEVPGKISDRSVPWVSMTISNELEVALFGHARRMGYHTLGTAEFYRDIILADDMNRFALPFGKITRADFVHAASQPANSLPYARLIGLDSIQCLRRMHTTLARFAWHEFFDIPSIRTPDKHILGEFQSALCRGRRVFHIEDCDAEFADSVLGLRARNARARIHAIGTPRTSAGKRAFYEDCLPRLRGEQTKPAEAAESVYCFDSVADLGIRLRNPGPGPADSEFIVRLRRNLFDFLDLANLLDATGTRHRLSLIQVSPDPARTYATGVLPY